VAGTILRRLLAWMAGSAGGTTSGGAGIMSGAPETLEIVTRSPLAMVIRLGSVASKKPQCTVSGPGSRCGMDMTEKISWREGRRSSR
jgi:hypothetical protein